MAKTASDLATVVEQVKKHYEENRSKIERLRSEIKKNNRRPLALKSVIDRARVEASELEKRALDRIAARFSISGFNDKHHFFPAPDARTAAAEFMDYFFAGGGAGAILEKILERKEAPDAIKLEEKDQTRSALTKELRELEEAGERARLELEKLGLYFPPDPDLDPEIFLQCSEFKSLEFRYDQLCAIGQRLLQDGNVERQSLQHAAAQLERLKDSTVSNVALEQQRALVRDLKLKQDERQKKIVDNNEERQQLGKLMQSCRQFLREQKI